MALTIGLDVARSSLAATAEQISVVSRNVSLAGVANGARKTAAVITGPGGNVTVSRITRATDDLLLDKALSSNSSAQTGKAIASALEKLQATVDDTDQERSPAALIGKLSDALQTYSANPSNVASALSAVSAAKDLGASLNSASAAVADVRRQADADIAASVARVNGLLQQFSQLNKEVVSGTRTGRDVTDQLDARDAVLKDLSSEIGIKTLQRADGDLAIFTESGVTMFDGSAREVSFSPSGSLPSGQLGAPVYVDGVPVAGTPQVMAIKNGKIAGLVAVRDHVAPSYEAKLDEIARGLIEAFAEHDQSAVPILPAAAGLFTYSGSPAVPASGSLIVGLAGDIRINANADPDQGGQPLRLRDGGISSPANPAYNYNPAAAASSSDRIQQLISQIEVRRPFDPSAGLGNSQSVAGFASAAVSALEAERSSVSRDASYRQVVGERAASALSKVTGVNLDEEMTRMLELERTYQASARLLTAIDGLLGTLLDSVR